MVDNNFKINCNIKTVRISYNPPPPLLEILNLLWYTYEPPTFFGRFVPDNANCIRSNLRGLNIPGGGPSDIPKWQTPPPSHCQLVLPPTNTILYETLQLQQTYVPHLAYWIYSPAIEHAACCKVGKVNHDKLILVFCRFIKFININMKDLISTCSGCPWLLQSPGTGSAVFTASSLSSKVSIDNTRLQFSNLILFSCRSKVKLQAGVDLPFDLKNW